MKRIISLFAVMLAIVAMMISVSAQQRPVYVTLDGEKVDCESYGQAATIVEGRTLVPLRAIFESLGANVIWDKETRTVISARGGTLIELTIGSNELIRNGESVEIDVPARILNNRTMVPARAVAESFGVSVEWDKTTRTVILTTVDKFGKTENGEIPSSPLGKNIYGEYCYGMTMQECWDKTPNFIGEKMLLAFDDGHAEIHISDEEGKFDKEITDVMGEYNVRLTRLVFEGDYLCSVCVISDYDTFERALEVGESVKKYYGNRYSKVDNKLYDDARNVEYLWQNGDGEIKCSFEEFFEDGESLGFSCVLSIAVKETSNTVDADMSKPAEEDSISESVELSYRKFLDAFVKFDVVGAADYCTNSAIIKKLGISDVDDVMPYVGFDKQKQIEKILAESYKGNENYRPIAEAVVNPMHQAIVTALGKCEYTIKECREISDTEVEIDVLIRYPDVRYILDSGTKLFQTAFTTALTKGMTDGTVGLGEMSEKELYLAIAPIVEETFGNAYLSCFEDCPYAEIIPEKAISFKLGYGKWLADIDGEYVTGILESFKIFE